VRADRRGTLDVAGESLARHGVAAPRGQAARGGRFGRMFATLPRPDPGARAVEQLAAAMHARALAGGSAENLDVRAGYTYLSQFVDHDLTFDPTSQLQRVNDPEALVDFRTPRFDLDSLYGSGPADQPYLYDWADDANPGVQLLVGHSVAGADLPRNRQGRALIGDARNDENLIVSQLHLLLLRFHNAVVDHLLGRGRRSRGGAELFEQAQRIVRWHYQWIVVHELLDKVVGKGMARTVREQRLFFAWHDEPFMPVEFSAAAFRFGHSMVRPNYRLNETPRSFPILGRGGLGGFRRLPKRLKIDWGRFFRLTDDVERRESSMLIDGHLSPPLFALPPDGASLARLNLQRGRALGLPAGPDVAQAMGVEPLSAQELGLDPAPAGIGRSSRDALIRATPLWYYVLREAEARGEHGGIHLGPVGGRIVGEVLLGLLEADPQSYVRLRPAWRPRELGSHGDFIMADLIRFTDLRAPPERSRRDP
jgi:Animal haem peroxidase